MENKLFISITTVKGREKILYETLDRLSVHSITPVVFKNDNPPGFLNLKENWINVLESFLISKKEYLLFLEDDIEVSFDFGSKLREIVEMKLDIITLITCRNYFYKKGKSNGVFEINSKSRYFMSQGLIISREVASFILNDTNFKHNELHFDVVFRDIPFKMHYITPNIVQHLDEKCMWRKNNRTINNFSKCYNG